MLTYVDESIFSSPARVLVNTVNTVGVMGKGLALEFKRLFPEMFRSYQQLCESRAFEIGTLQLFRTANKEILNFPTKKHWRSPSQVEYIERGLEAFVRLYRDWEIPSISFPQLGCGNGELDWEEQVRPIMERYLADLPIDVFVHIYSTSGIRPEHRTTDEMRAWLRGQPRSLSVFEVWEDLFHEPIPEQPEDSELIVQEDDKSTEDFYVLRWIWERLRTFGFISTSDASGRFGERGEIVAAALLRLPYVEEVRFAVSGTSKGRPTTSTFDLLTEPNASGLRLVPEKVPPTFKSPQLQTKLIW